MSVWTATLLGLCGVTLLVLLRRVELAGGGAWWRVLVPSWRFFEAEDATFALEVRRIGADGEAGSFVPAIPPARRGPLALLFSPRHNLCLACHDLIERWVLELSETGPLEQADVERLPSYALVQSAVTYFLRGVPSEPGTRYQLRLRECTGDDPDDALFLSPEHALD